MLTQRTVAVFQRLLASMMSQHYAFLEPPLNDGLCYNKLFEANVPRRVLDVLANKTMFDPIGSTLYLFEGSAVALARGKPYPSDDDRQVGAGYLLCFMAMALTRYESLSYDTKAAYEQFAKELIHSMGLDGYRYASGHIFETATGEPILPVPLDQSSPREVVPAKVQPPVVGTKSDVREPVQPSSGEGEASEGIGCVGVATVIAVPIALMAVFAGIFQTELNHWIKAHWHLWFH
jgi:hypothetical protein